MSAGYQAVGWNRQKKLYDALVALGITSYLGAFAGAGAWLHPSATAETLLIRGLGTGAFLLLHVVLSIGPLARLDRRFLPLLYNRRHLGVATFGLALCHAGFALVQFHALGDVNPFVSLLSSNTRYGSLPQFPFEALGLVALVILFLMAATSHDFWLANLTAPVWKRLHMLVYVAYAAIVLHVVLGVLQAERSPLLAGVLALGVVWLVALHLAAARREWALDREAKASQDDEFVEVCRLDEIAEKRARIACVSGERIAVFRYEGRLAAVSNVCQHQNGPLGEGRIIDGCITCPWHGYQYLPHNGRAPAPFTEKLPTFRVRLEHDRVLVDPRPLPPGTQTEPAVIADALTPRRQALAGHGRHA